MKRKRITTFIAIAVGLFIFLGLNSYFKLGLIETTVSYTKPVGTVISGVGESISGFFGNITKIGSLPKENKELQAKLDQAIAEIARLSSAQKENEELREDLNFKRTNKFALVGANVIFFDPNNAREAITLDVGEVDGLKKGDVVLARGFLVGKIQETTAHSSKVILITDPDSAIPATLADSPITGIAKGKIGSGLILDQVPQSEKVNMGDIVMTSGLGGEFPKGLVVGKVDSVQQISGSIFQAIEIRPMVDLSKLDKVMVIKA